MCSFAYGCMCTNVCLSVYLSMCVCLPSPVPYPPRLCPALTLLYPSLSYPILRSYPILSNPSTQTHIPPSTHALIQTSIHPSIRPPVRPSMHPSIDLSVCVCLFSCPPTYLMSTCPSAYLPTYLASQLAVYPSIHRSIIYLCICLFLYLSD